MDISVIIPCHNGAKYLPKLANCLKPLLTPDVEVILVDDGSTDGSAELFQQLMPRAVCLKQQSQGPGAARNRGAEVARGEFLQLLDADDTVEPGKFETQLAFARSHSFDVVYSDWRMVIVDGDAETCEPWVSAETRTEIVEALLGGWWFSTAAPLVRTCAYRAVGGCDPTLLNTCDDFDLWVRMGIAGCRFGYVPGRFANYYRYHQVRSISRKNPRKFFEGEARIILNAVRLLEAKNADTPARRNAAARRLHSVARNVYALDKDWFRRLMQDVKQVDPEFRSTGALSYRVATRFLGFEGAERLTVWKRKALSKSNYLTN